MQMTRRAPAVEMAIQILEFLGRNYQRRWSIAELARELKVNKATCHTVALTLVAGGYLVRDEVEKRYALGPTVARLGALVGQINNYVQVALGHLQPLADKLGLCAYLTTMLPDGQTLVVGKADAPRLFHSTVWIGRTAMPPTVSSDVLVAWRAPDDIRHLYARWQSNMPSLEEFERRVASVRKDGFSMYHPAKR
jgi:DNA-binding IclR family transcriptional regulator